MNSTISRAKRLAVERHVQIMEQSSPTRKLFSERDDDLVDLVPDGKT